MSMTKKVKIEKLNVIITKFDPFKAGVLLGTTVKMFSNALKDIVSALEKDLSEAEQLEVFIGAVSGLFEKNEPEAVMEYIEDIVATGYIVIGDKKVTDLNDFTVLAGEDGDGLHLASLVLIESIKFNFSKFLGKLTPVRAS